MKFTALKTWMIAGVIMLAGGTSAFVALDVTGTDEAPPPFVAQRDPAAVQEVAAAPDQNQPVQRESVAEAAGVVNEIFSEAALEEPAEAEPAPLAAPQAAVNNGETDTFLSDEARAYLRDGIDGVTADLLGLSVAEPRDARDGGQRLNDLLGAAGISREVHQTAVTEAWPGIVQGAAEAGLVTSDQAAELLENRPRIGGRNGSRNENPPRQRNNRQNGRGRSRGGNNQGNPPPGNNA